MHFNIEHAKKMADILGAEAISDYAIWGNGGLNGSPYSELTAAARNAWIKSEATGAQVAPLVMTGWDRRPRIERPVPWETGWQKPYEGNGKIFRFTNTRRTGRTFERSNNVDKRKKTGLPCKDSNHLRLE